MNETLNMCAQVKKKLNARQPLTGKYLDFALSLVPPRTGGQYDKTADNMERQLRAGEPLGDYEQHLMVDVYLLHLRLAAEHEESLEMMKTLDDHRR